MMNPNIYSTKFIISVLCLIMLFIGFMMNKISADIFLPFLLGIQGVYTSGNILGHQINKVKS